MIRRTVGPNGSAAPLELLAGLAQLTGLLDLRVIDLVPGGLVRHGLEGNVRTAQQLGGHLRGNLFVGDQVVHGLDLLLRLLQARPVVAHPLPGGLRCPGSLSGPLVQWRVFARLPPLVVVGDRGRGLVGAEGHFRTSALFGPQVRHPPVLPDGVVGNVGVFRQPVQPCRYAEQSVAHRAAAMILHRADLQRAVADDELVFDNISTASRIWQTICSYSSRLTLPAFSFSLLDTRFHLLPTGARPWWP
ncbi:hypothetical protein ACVWXU_001979 [Streptomyces sp. TE33382]